MPTPDTFRHVLDARLTALQTEYDRHKADCVEVPSAYLEEKSAVFGTNLHDAVASVLPIILCSQINQIHFDPRLTTPVPNYSISDYTHIVNPKTIDQLKNLVGVPNAVHELADKTKVQRRLTERIPVELIELPTAREFTFAQLPGPQRLAVHNAAQQLLYGHVDDAMIRQPPYAAVSRYLMERSQSLPVFTGNDLIICPGRTVYFSGYAAVYFNNVIAIGDGRIVCGSHTKLHSYQIKHI